MKVSAWFGMNWDWVFVFGPECWYIEVGDSTSIMWELRQMEAMFRVLFNLAQQLRSVTGNM